MKKPKVLLLIETNREYGRGLVKGITKYSLLNGPWTVELETPFYIQTSKNVQLGIDPTEWDVDGVIMRDNKFTKKVIDIGIPVVFVSCQIKNTIQTSGIITNSEAIGKIAAEYFLSKGFMSYAYLGLEDFYWSEIRREYFARTVEKNGYNVSVYKFPKKKDILWAEEQFIVAEWLKSLPKPVGLMACNDDRGMGAIAAARVAGLKVPDDVAIIGCDNDEFICKLANPPLSSIALGTEQAGFEAAMLLDKLMSRRKAKPQSIMVNPTGVVERRSSGILAINDRQVVEAVSYIYDHCREPIQIDDVAEAVGISRRGLYDKFKKTLNCTISSYINQVRTDQIARWLIDTNMSISQIAIKLGFPSSDHIAQYFRKHKGVNPSEYRSKHRNSL